MRKNAIVCASCHERIWVMVSADRDHNPLALIPALPGAPAGRGEGDLCPWCDQPFPLEEAPAGQKVLLRDEVLGYLTVGVLPPARVA